MSAYLSFGTPMTDEATLLEALADMGFDASKVEVHATPTALVGFAGDARAASANVVIRRRHLSPSSNDVGFVATPTGYRAIVSAFDRGRFDEAWLRGLQARYETRHVAREARLAEEARRRAEEARRRLVEAQRAAVVERAKRLGYAVQETRQGDSVRLVLVKRTY